MQRRNAQLATLFVCLFGRIVHRTIRIRPYSLKPLFGTPLNDTRESIFFKRCNFAYKAIHGLATCYLNKLCITLSTVPILSVQHSAARGDLVVPRTRLQLGILCGWSGRLEQSPTDIRSAPTLSTFKTCSRHLSRIPTH